VRNERGRDGRRRETEERERERKREREREIMSDGGTATTTK